MTILDLEAAKAKLLADMGKKWDHRSVVNAVQELIELVPGQALEKWLASHMKDGDGNNITIEGNG